MPQTFDYSASSVGIDGAAGGVVNGTILPAQFWSPSGGIHVQLNYMVPEWNPPYELTRDIQLDVEGVRDTLNYSYLPFEPRAWAGHPEFEMDGGLPGPGNLVLMNVYGVHPSGWNAYTVFEGIAAPAWDFGTIPALFASTQAMDAFFGSRGLRDGPLWDQLNANWAASVAPIYARELSSVAAIRSQWTVLDGIMRLTFTGDPNSAMTIGDLLRVDANVIFPFANEDVLIIMTPHDDQVDFGPFGYSARRLELRLGAGDDTLDFYTPVNVNLGTRPPDHLAVSGGAGFDVIGINVSGSAFVDGGDGVDWITVASVVGDASAVTVLGGRGEDSIEVYAGETNRLSGGASNDFIVDDTAEGKLFGGSGDDDLNGGGGSDRIVGGSGDDLIAGDFGFVEESNVFGADQLFGGGGDDTMFGDDGNDSLFGGNGSDKLDGGVGRDLLVGGRSDDDLSGGEGADRFVFRRGMGSDRIEDFDHRSGDILALDNSLWTGNLGTAQVIARFAGVVGGFVTFDFGARGQIVLEGLGTLRGLNDTIDIV